MSLRCFNNVAYEQTNYGPFNAWLPVPQEIATENQITTLIEDNADRIPLALWHSCLAFMQWGFDTHKSEVMVLFFYDKRKPVGERWAAWAPPQKLKGLSVDCDENDPRWKEQRAAFGTAAPFGSLHHHCTLGAFASGKDAADEARNPGIHITVGKMNTTERDWHARVTIRHHTVTVPWDLFIENNSTVMAVPAKVARTVALAIKSNEPKGTEFPDQWKANCILPPPRESLFTAKETKGASVGNALAVDPRQMELPGVPPASFRRATTVEAECAFFEDKKARAYDILWSNPDCPYFEELCLTWDNTVRFTNNTIGDAMRWLNPATGAPSPERLADLSLLEEAIRRIEKKRMHLFAGVELIQLLPEGLLTENGIEPHNAREELLHHIHEVALTLFDKQDVAGDIKKTGFSEVVVGAQIATITPEEPALTTVMRTMRCAILGAIRCDHEQ